jgi:hypothetical protein
MPARFRFFFFLPMMVAGLAAAGNDAAPSSAAAPEGPLRITSPARGERWAAGSRHWIEWEGAPASAPVRLEFSPDGGRSWQEVAAAAPEGGFLWTVPDRVSRNCRLRVAAEGRTAVAEFAVIPSAQVPEYAWTAVNAKAAFAPRDGAGAVTFNGRMWLLGGWNPGDKTHFPRICNNEVWSSADGREWTLEKPNTFLAGAFDPTADWEGRHTAGYAVHRNRIWIVGGDVNQGHYQPDVWSSADGKRWTHVNPGRPVPWGPRALHYTVAFRDRLWVMGGQTMPAFAPSEERFYRDVWRSADGVNWEQVTPREPYWSPRGMIGGSAVFKDRIWVLGGGTYDTPTTPTRNFYNDVWSSPDGARWTRHTARAPWEPRQYHEVAVWDGRLWVLEGYGGGNRNDVWYSADGVNWYEVPETPWKPRHAASVFVHDGALWMVAGNNMESDVWKLQRRR